MLVSARSSPIGLWLHTLALRPLLLLLPAAGCCWGLSLYVSFTNTGRQCFRKHIDRRRLTILSDYLY